MARSFRSVITVGVVAIASLATTAVPVRAAKVQKPGTPKVVVVSVRKTSSKYATYTFVVELSTVGGRPTSTIVETGWNKSCTIKGTRTSCSVANIRTTRYLTISAYSKNSAGSSKKSKGIGLYPATGYVRTGYSLSGKKFPSALTLTSNSRILADNTGKWAKFQPLRRSGVMGASSRSGLRPRVPAGSVVFQTSNIIGVALPSNAQPCGSGQSAACAVGIGADGSNSSFLAPGSAPAYVRDFYAAPNNKFYVVFASATALVSGGPSCVLAEIDVQSGVPTCVDNSLQNVAMSMGSTFGNWQNGNPPIQFDDAGSIYYSGIANNKFALRKNVNGQVADLINDNVTVRDYLVLNDGSVLIAGTTTSTQAWWFRKITPTGGVVNLAANIQMNFMRRFADGNVYFGALGGVYLGGQVKRYITSTGALDPTPWIGDSRMGMTATNNTAVLCAASGSSGLCSGNGSNIRAAYNVAGGQTIVVAGSPGIGGTSLVVYYPTLAYAPTVVTSVTLSYQVGNKLIIAGTNEAGTNVLTILDTTTMQETILMDASNEVEIYNMGYVPSTNKLMFNGLRFSDNKYVVGEVTLP